MKNLIDPHFTVELLSSTHVPQQLIYAAMHQDYSPYLAHENLKWDYYYGVTNETFPSTEPRAGEVLVRRLLKGDRGHYGPLEHPQIVFNIGYFPHSTMQQIRTHRVGISFDVQSFRYTSERIANLGEMYHKVDSEYELAITLELAEETFYLRPLGIYTNRQGKTYQYTEVQRASDLIGVCMAARKYWQRLDQGFSEEHVRGLIPFDVRQHWVMSCNVRSLMHLLDLRFKADAQLECQQLCQLILPHFKQWVPDIASWYDSVRLKKARLAP